MCYILDSEEIVGIWIIVIVMAITVIFMGFALFVVYHERKDLLKEIDALKKENQNIKNLSQKEVSASTKTPQINNIGLRPRTHLTELNKLKEEIRAKEQELQHSEEERKRLVSKNAFLTDAASRQINEHNRIIAEYEAKIKAATDKVDWSRKSETKKDEIIDSLIQKIEEKERACEQECQAMGAELAKFKRAAGNIDEIKDCTDEFRKVATAGDLCGVMEKFVERYIEEKIRLIEGKPSKGIEELKKDVKEIKLEYTRLKIYHERILQTFPELEDYIGEYTLLRQDEDLVCDKARDYLSDEEYHALSEDERNQLALERYMKHPHRKNSWVAGIEYEMSYSYKLREEKFDVEEYGAEYGKNDLGRDIIARKNGKTYIIQCKRYAEGRKVHENVICQLLGTTWHYIVTHPEIDPKNIRPALVTTAELTDTAQKIARLLKVEIRRRRMQSYPMIKCNINDGNKIYHLPFDPQYWRTKIRDKGEFYAWKVEDAVRVGFRRAKKGSKAKKGNKNN